MKTALFSAKIVAGLAIFTGFFYISSTTYDPDLWWHLRVGEEELASYSIPRFDEYSFTMAGYGWVDHEWLVDAGLRLVYSNGLWLAAAFMFSLLAYLPVFFWIKRAKSFLGLTVILTAATFMANIVGVRPQMISIALFFLLFEVIRKRFEGGKNYFWALPLLFFIWANLHGGFAVGLGFLAFSVFIYYAERIFKKIKIELNDLSRDAFILLLSCLAPLINPYGTELYAELFRVILSSDTAKYISEWQSVLNVYIFSSLIIIGLFTALGMSGIFRKNYSAPLFWGAVAMLALFLKSVRHGPLFLIAAMPFMILGADKIEEIVFNYQNTRLKPRLIRAVFSLATISLAIFGYQIYGAGNYPYPDRAVEFLAEKARNGESIRIFNDYGWGGYLIYEVPEIKVFIDGRMPHWADESGEGAMKDYVKVYFGENPSEWQEVFKRRGINTVLTVNNQEPTGAFGAKLRKRLLENYYIRKFYNFVVVEEAFDIKEDLLKNNWKIVYEDEVAVVYSKLLF